MVIFIYLIIDDSELHEISLLYLKQHWVIFYNLQFIIKYRIWTFKIINDWINVKYKDEQFTIKIIWNKLK